MMLSCGLCEKSIDTDQDEFLISKRLREQIEENNKKKDYLMNKHYSVNFHYDCALEHDDLMTYDDFNDRGSEQGSEQDEDYRNDLD